MESVFSNGAIPRLRMLHKMYRTELVSTVIDTELAGHGQGFKSCLQPIMIILPRQ